MYPIIDFRNARYQGQTKNHLPDGIGLLIDNKMMFCMAEWVAGEIRGPAVIIFPSGRVFCGHISFRQAEQITSHELAEDHVQLITFCKSGRGREPEKIAAILPLLRVIFEIDNTDPREAKVLQEYQYSIVNQSDNLRTVSRILNLDASGPEGLRRHANCLRFMREYFAAPHGDIIEFMINERNAKKEYFFGLRGGGLGIKIEPLEEPTLNLKQTGRVYLIRALGVFSRQTQVKQLGLKIIDNAMKGVVVEQGIYSLPNTLIKYELGKRPMNCLTTFYNYLKRSLHYRDKVIPLMFLYDLERFVDPFNSNLRKIQTQKIAQMTIEQPNNTGTNLIEIQQKRSQKERDKEEYLRRRGEVSNCPNPYNPDCQTKYTNPDYNLERAKDEIYRSISKKQKSHNAPEKVDYSNVEYIDPNYIKVKGNERQPRNVSAMMEREGKDNESGYVYDSNGKDYKKEFNSYYQRKLSPKKDTRETEMRTTSRSPDPRDSPQRGYDQRSPPRLRNSPERGYPNRSPPRYTDRYENSKDGQDAKLGSYKAHRYDYDEGGDSPYRRNQRGDGPYRRDERQQTRPYQRQEAGYDRKHNEKYDYYFDEELRKDSHDADDSYQKRQYRERKSRSPYRPNYGLSPGKSNLRKKILKDSRYD